MSEAHLYFAFGSNLDGDQMRRRCSCPIVVGKATLRGYRLAFAGFSAMRGGGVATVVKSDDHAVPGLLYRLTDADLQKLDACEGHPQFYRRVAVHVVDSDGERRRAWTYTLDRAERAPSPDYAAIIAGGYGRLGYDEAPLLAAIAAAPTIRTTAVFVYGSLRRNEYNHRLLVDIGARFVAEARTPPHYRLLDLGAYPAVVRDGKTAIVGEVYDVDDAGLLALDRLEGVPRLYRRHVVQLQADRGEALIYAMDASQVAGRPEVKGGDWCRAAAVAKRIGDVVRRAPADPLSDAAIELSARRASGLGGVVVPLRGRSGDDVVRTWAAVPEVSQKGQQRRDRRAARSGAVPGLERVAALTAAPIASVDSPAREIDVGDPWTPADGPAQVRLALADRSTVDDDRSPSLPGDMMFTRGRR